MTAVLPILRTGFVLLALVVGGPAAGGAWPQERGHGFVSTDTRISRPQNALRDGDLATYNTLYAEYGLTDRLTLGVDLGRSVSGADKAVIFLRYPLSTPLPDTRVAVALGFGQIGNARVVRPGVSLGRSFTMGDKRYGWFSAEAVAEYERRLAHWRSCGRTY